MRIWEEGRKTVLFVTHQIDEAVFLSDRVLVLARRPGRVQETIDVALPRPRALAIKRTPEFTAYVDRIWRLIEDGVRASVIEDAPAQGCAQQSRLVPRLGPSRDRPQWVQIGVGRRVRVLHRHAGAEFDMLADSLAKRFVARHAGRVQCRRVELDEARPPIFSNMEAAVHGDQMGEPEFPAEPVRPAK
jgi:hypothetical protein